MLSGGPVRDWICRYSVGQAVRSPGRRGGRFLIIDRARVEAALPDYELGLELGSGAFGLVVAGRHRRLHRDVAIKILASELDADEFEAEARVLAGLDHPHVVRIYDCREHGGLGFIVMELLPGGSLRQRTARRHGSRRRSVETACAIGLAVAGGVGAAHRRNVLHRDIKPENMLFAADDRLKVTDFGLAKAIDGSAVAASRIVGTPLYMAPEQFDLRELRPATDVYALGVVLYEVLTGAHPFADHRRSFAALQHCHLNEVPPPPVGIPGPIADVMARALAKAPDDRPATAGELALQLARAARDTLGAGWLDRAELVPHLDDDVRVLAWSTGGDIGSPTTMSDLAPTATPDSTPTAARPADTPPSNPPPSNPPPSEPPANDAGPEAGAATGVTTTAVSAQQAIGPSTIRPPEAPPTSDEALDEDGTTHRPDDTNRLGQEDRNRPGSRDGPWPAVDTPAAAGPRDRPPGTGDSPGIWPHVVLGVAALASIGPFLAPVTSTMAYYGTLGAWAVWGPFAVVLAALPVVLALRVTLDRWAAVRAPTTGAAFGLAALTLGALAEVRQQAIEYSHPLRAGWWVSVAAASLVLAVTAFARLRRAPDAAGRVGPALAALGFVALLLFPDDPYWTHQASFRFGQATAVTVLAGLALLVLLFRRGAPPALLTAAAVAVTSVDLLGWFRTTPNFQVGNATVLIALLALSLVTDPRRKTDRAFLLAAGLSGPLLAVRVLVDYQPSGYAVASTIGYGGFALLVVAGFVAARRRHRRVGPAGAERPGAEGTAGPPPIRTLGSAGAQLAATLAAVVVVALPLGVTAASTSDQMPLAANSSAGAGSQAEPASDGQGGEPSDPEEGTAGDDLPAVAGATDLTTEPVVSAGSGSPPTSLVTRDLVAGIGPAASASGTVTIHYVGVRWRDGKVFDSSWGRGASDTFSLRTVIDGFARGIEGMRTSGRREIVIPPDLGYGPAGGQPPDIAADDTLVFVVDLISVAPEPTAG